mgnify:CR=1 FL=1
MAKNTRTFVDIDMNFDRNPVTGDIFRNTDANAIAFAMKNILLTGRYEKPFKPNFGSGVKGFLFENINPLSAISLQKEITSSISNFEPRVNLKQVIVQANPDQNRYDVVVDFFIANNPNQVSINFFLERIR